MSSLWIWKVLQTHNKLIEKEYNEANYSDQTAVYTQPYFADVLWWILGICLYFKRGKKKSPGNSADEPGLETTVWKPRA